jgi:hypothetical protein
VSAVKLAAWRTPPSGISCPRRSRLAVEGGSGVWVGVRSIRSPSSPSTRRIAWREEGTAKAAPPRWTAPAWSDSSPGLRVPFALASGDAAAAFMFAGSLRAGHPSNPVNKILLVVRDPRNGSPLAIVARSRSRTMRLRFPDDASPGEIYPSIIDLPAPGCWRLTLRWSSHRASIDLRVRAAAISAARRRAAPQRPLHLPLLRPGAPCPVSRAHPIAGFVAAALGPGPVYAVLGRSVLPLELPAAAGSGGLFAGSAWGAGKTLWVATARYRGPVVVRGREIDGPHAVRFGKARVPSASLRLAAPGAYSVGEPAGWRAWPSETRLRAGGCYAFQVDGANFSLVVVFRAIGAAAA